MLKSAGVDRFSLVQRLLGMDREQLENLNRIYDAQRVVVMRRVDEARLCETCLLQSGFAESLEEQLIRMLPAAKDTLDTMASGPAGPFVHRTDLLPEIALESPVKGNRTLASIALLHLGKFSRRDFAAMVEGLEAEQAVATESAFAIAHWRVRLYACSDVWPRPDWWCGFSSQKLVRAVRSVRLDSLLGPWAAAALALGLFRDQAGIITVPEDQLSRDEREVAAELRLPLRIGIGSSDPDLRFTCAMALGEDTTLAAELQSSDSEKASIARRSLARMNSPAISGLLTEGPSGTQAEILQNLTPPLPSCLLEPVLFTFEKGDAGWRDKIVWLLQSNLTESIVKRLLAIVLKEKDRNVFRELLRLKSLPGKRDVIRAVINAGLLPELAQELYDDAYSIDFSDEGLMSGVWHCDSETIQSLLTIALWQVQRDPANEQVIIHVGRFLVRVIFGPYPMDLRGRAYELLTDYRLRPHLNWLEPTVAIRLLGGIGEFVTAIVSLVGDIEARALCYRVISDVYHAWEGLVSEIGRNPDRLEEFLRAVHSCAKTEAFQNLVAHTQALAETAPQHPRQVFPILCDLLSDAVLFERCPQIPVHVLGSYEQLREPLRKNLALAGEFIDALAGHLQPGSPMDYPRLILMDLLAAALADLPEHRSRVAERLMPLITGLDEHSEWDKERLQRLADLVGLAADTRQKEVVSESQPSEALDHEVLLGDQPLTTLADYAAFMKEMGMSSSPLEVMARHNLSIEEYTDCVRAWGELISRRNDVAIRYALLCDSACGIER